MRPNRAGLVARSARGDEVIARPKSEAVLRGEALHRELEAVEPRVPVVDVTMCVAVFGTSLLAPGWIALVVVLLAIAWWTR